MLSRYVVFHLEFSKCITRIYVELILTAILISRHHSILYTRALKTNSYINRSKLCLLQSHFSSSSTWQHHFLVPQPDACQTLNELVQRDYTDRKQITFLQTQFTDRLFHPVQSLQSSIQCRTMVKAKGRLGEEVRKGLQ